MSTEVAFLLQVALILGLARACGEILRRLEQPPVLGELLAGIVLGPSLFGWLWPEGQSALFEHTGHLESLAQVGLVLLMLFTGLETDIRVMRTMGRAAFMASLFGIAIPFGTGLLLGYLLPDEHVFKGRLPLMLFLATAMGISAMPVIAKILIDLNLVQRDFGVLTLSAAVVDDTIGWIVLAAIAGMVTTGSFSGLQVLLTLGLVALFLVAARYILYPLLRGLLPRADHLLRMPGGELVLIVVATMLCAAATEAMHVHAVFGAFVAGVMLRQCPTIKAENIHNLELVGLSLFAPLFFGSVGLRVDFHQLTGFGLPLLIFVIAVTGKVVGCFLGGWLGKLNPWASLALGFCMSARGAMELVVAKIGFDLGILDVELFSCIVLMAVLTSFLAPVLVRSIIHKVPLSEDEKRRGQSAAGRFLPSGALRVLVPAGGGPNARQGSHLAAHLCQKDGDRCTILHVQGTRRTFWNRLLFWRKHPADLNFERYFRQIKESAGEHAKYLQPLGVPSPESTAHSILSEAARHYHLVFIGASGSSHPVYDPFVNDLVRRCPCHVVIVKGMPLEIDAPVKPFQRILVPTNGSYVSDAAFELAAAYARSTGARIDLLYISESERRNPLLPIAALEPVAEHVQDMLRTTLREQYLERFPHADRLGCQVRESASVLSGMLAELKTDSYDLVVLGAENKSLVERLYLGQHIESVVLEAPCALALVIPKL